MKAVVYRAFGAPPELENVPDPVPGSDGVVIRVGACGICLSDWHGWQGHDPDIRLPHVPGHELAGVVETVGENVRKWRAGDRVTVPFVSGCGACRECLSGNHQVCDYQFQPGFTHWGSFAEFVAVNHADINLVRLPDSMDFATAASLGCRFATAFRGIVDRGRASAGEWVVVFGCGGVGLSAVMIAAALGASVVAVDIEAEKLALAGRLGASKGINSRAIGDVAAAVRDLTDGGAHVSVDAIGNADACRNAIESLRKRGRHVQIGLMTGADSMPRIPLHRVIANELELYGSHGMQAYRYAEMLAMVTAGKLSPEKLIGRRVSLDQSIAALTSMHDFGSTGVTVITEF